jgi:hypothetical protein
MSVMKQVVMNLSTRKYGEKKTQSRDLARPKKYTCLEINIWKKWFILISVTYIVTVEPV